MTDSRIDLRKPWLAALLAFLVPGLGHAYQRRFFKALLYFVCICGMFVTGARMSEWKAIQAPPFNYRTTNRSLLMLKFAAQIGMGLPSLTALVQSRRFQSAANDLPKRLEHPFSAPFQGTLTWFSSGPRDDQDVRGTITFESVQTPYGETIGGRFVGTAGDGTKLDLVLDHHTDLGRRIGPDPNRFVMAGVFPEGTEGRTPSGKLEGAIPRPIADWLFVPLDEPSQQALEGRLGKWLELALVLTWIAGLLNMLAVWDALEGPAWGYTDQPDGGRPAIVAQTPLARPPVREAMTAG